MKVLMSTRFYKIRLKYKKCFVFGTTKIGNFEAIIFIKNNHPQRKLLQKTHFTKVIEQQVFIFLFLVIFLIAWLISTRYKIPVTAGPINPKLPALVKSARFKM